MSAFLDIQDAPETARVSEEAGFTLVEVLVALFIFAVISVGTFGSFQGAVAAKDATADATARHETLSLMRAQLRADFSNMIIRRNRDPFGGVSDIVFRGGFETLLEFTRVGRINPAGVFVRSDIQRVSYILDDGQLMRRALRHENPAPLTETNDRVLMTNIAAADVSFSFNDVSVPQIEISTEVSQINIDYVTLNLRFEDGRELTQIFEMEAL